mmetsp:Transcript_4859/g.21962  ORF Transcript_4859/g.21962 Transcript_4859/m.21962 type:complete len:240 (+) Transcript_4859:921-1640(+)
MRGDGTRLAEHLAALHLVALQAAQQKPAVIARLTLVEGLLEHLHARHRRLLRRHDADELHVLARLHDTLLDAAGRHGTATLDGEHVLHGHRERLVERALGGRERVARLHQLEDSLLAQLVVGALQRVQRGAADDGDVVAVELVKGEHLPQLHLHQVDELLVVHHVNLVQEDRQAGNADLARQQDVLARLRHGAIRRGHHQDAAVHLRGTGDHVLDVIGVAGAVDVGVVALVGLVLDVRG